MHWKKFIPELVLLGLIVICHNLEPSGVLYLSYGLLYGALIGAIWNSFETEFADAGSSKVKDALLGVAGAAPLVCLYLLFGSDFFTIAEIDRLLFRNRTVTTQEHRDIAILSIFGAMAVLVSFRVIDR